MPKKAFTLIELLIAISIIGVLAAAITVGYASNIRRSKCTRLAQDFDAISKAATAYRETNDRWADDVNLTQIQAGTYPAFVPDYLKTWPSGDYYKSGYLFDYERYPAAASDPSLIAISLKPTVGAAAVEYYCIQDLRSSRNDCLDLNGDGNLNNDNLPTPLNRGGACAL